MDNTLKLPSHNSGFARDYNWCPVRPIACPSCGTPTPIAPHGLPCCPNCREEVQPLKVHLHSLCWSPLFFLRQFWIENKYVDHHTLTWLEEDMFQFAEGSILRVDPEADRLKYRKRCVLGFRGMGKTYSISGVLPPFRWYQEKYLNLPVTRQVVIISKVDNEAEKTAGLIRRSLETVWFLRPLAPTKRNPSKSLRLKDSTKVFDVTGKPDNQRAHSLQVKSITAGISGNRAHTVIKDDIEQETNTLTPEARERLAAANEESVRFLYSDLGDSAKKLPAPTEDLLVGTPKHLETIYQKVSAQGYITSAYPILYPDHTHRIIHPAKELMRRLAKDPSLAGQPTCPVRFPMSEIEKYRMSEALFRREYMLEADLGHRNFHPLKLRNLIVLDTVHRDKAPASIQWGTMDNNGSTIIDDCPTVGLEGDHLHRPANISREWVSYTLTRGWIDPAGGGHDKTGLAIGGYAAGLIHVKCAVGLTGSAAENDEDSLLTRLALILRKHRCQQVYIERNYAGDLFSKLLNPILRAHSLEPGKHPEHPDGWSCAIIDDPKTTTANTQKESRIIAILEPALSEHRIVIGKDTIRYDPTRELHEQLQHQLTHLNHERGCLKLYDILDALAGLMWCFRDMMDVDPTISAQRAIARQMQNVKRPWLPPEVRSAFENRIARERRQKPAAWSNFRRPGDP